MNQNDVLPTRKSLLIRLKRWDDQESWRQFFDGYWKLIYSVALKAGLPPEQAEDVVQETVLSVAKQMPSFEYDSARGSFKSWLLAITRRRVADHFRARRRQVALSEFADESPSRTAIIEKIPAEGGGDFDALWNAEWEKHLLQLALRRVRRQVDPRQYQIFDCYALKGWPVAEVTKSLEVTASQVYLAKHRISTQLRAEVRRLEAEGFA